MRIPGEDEDNISSLHKIPKGIKNGKSNEPITEELEDFAEVEPSHAQINN